MDSQDILDQFLVRLIESPATDQTIKGLGTLFEHVLITKKCLPNFDIPYDDITVYIYTYQKIISTGDLDEMMNQLDAYLQNKYPVQACGKKDDKHKCFSKFRTHIYLAATQKEYILRVTQEQAEDANTVAIAAQTVANKADESARKANKLAKKSKQLYGNMMVNYVTILGIFATIIITLFGGINIISSTIKLLEGSAKLPYLTFIVSALMICLMTLLNLLIKWISSLNYILHSKKLVDNSDSNIEAKKNQKESADQEKNQEQTGGETSTTWRNKWFKFSFYTQSLIVFSVIIFLSLICILFDKKEDKTFKNTDAFFYKTETYLKQRPMAVADEQKDSKSTGGNLSQNKDKPQKEEKAPEFKKYLDQNPPITKLIGSDS